MADMELAGNCGNNHLFRILGQITEGRDYEQEIAAEYLTQLNELYEAWVESFGLCPVLTVPTDDLNFVAVNSHLELIASRVLDKLHGKEVVVFD